MPHLTSVSIPRIVEDVPEGVHTTVSRPRYTMSVLLNRTRRVRRGSPPSRPRLFAAVAALFTFDGAVFGSWAARIPDVTTQVGASHTALGLALLYVATDCL